MKKIIFLFLILLLPLSIFAITFESNNLSDVYKHVDKNSLVVFDIDHTMGEVSMGIEPWIHTKTQKLIQKGIPKKEAFEFVLAMYFLILDLTSLIPLSNSPSIVKNLQDRDIPVIALTNRSIPIMYRTITQLKDAGIDLSKNHLYKKDLDLEVTHRGIYSHGIIFTGSNDKGVMLIQFLKKIGYTPKKIIFVDDRMEHIKSVQKQANKYKIPYVGIRFSLNDPVKENFDHNKAEQTINKLKIKLGMNPIKQAHLKKLKPTTVNNYKKTAKAFIVKEK